MSQFKQIQTEVELINTLKFIAQAFEEISVMRMRKVRLSVVNAREFVSELSTVFHDVKSSYEEKIKLLVSQKKLSTGQTAIGKKLAILVSANSKLYGEIISNVFYEFYESTQSPDTDILIIGRLGKELYERQPIKKNYLYFEIPDTEVVIQDIQAIMFHLIRYENIDVHYAHFENILHQIPIISNITGDDPFYVEAETAEEKKQIKLKRFVFEPDMEKILEFFKSQVFVALFKQTIHEAHLAHYASRVNAMELALTHIETQSQILYSEQRKAKKSEENKKMLERIAGRNIYQ